MTAISVATILSRSCRPRSIVAGVCLAALSACGSGESNAGGTTLLRPASLPEPAPSAPRSSASIFFSGHSLTDNPLPDYVASIATSLNTQLAWNQQVTPGSPIRVRSRGRNANATSFDGYNSGKNRSGSGMDVVSELRQPQTLDGQRYDTLVVAERHDIVNTIIWEGTVQYTRHFHDRLIEGNPSGSTYLYHAWLGVPNKGSPADWIAYERTVAPAWQCVASRINESLRHEGRSDRVQYLPAGLALASLVEQATQGAGVPGVTGASVRETMDRIFSDDVHLTPLGTYYMALVNYGAVYRRSPAGAWAPPDVVDAAQAQALQSVAWRAVASHISTFASPPLSQCRQVMRETVCSAFSNFTNRPDQAASCARTFAATTQSNPFHFDAALDRSYWYPAP